MQFIGLGGAVPKQVDPQLAQPPSDFRVPSFRRCTAMGPAWDGTVFNKVLPDFSAETSLEFVLSFLFWGIAPSILRLCPKIPESCVIAIFCWFKFFASRPAKPFLR
jgi:hypothetical protein